MFGSSEEGLPTSKGLENSCKIWESVAKGKTAEEFCGQVGERKLVETKSERERNRCLHSDSYNLLKKS